MELNVTVKLMSVLQKTERFAVFQYYSNSSTDIVLCLMSKSHFAFGNNEDFISEACSHLTVKLAAKSSVHLATLASRPANTQMDDFWVSHPVIQTQHVHIWHYFEKHVRATHLSVFLSFLLCPNLGAKLSKITYYVCLYFFSNGMLPLAQVHTHACQSQTEFGLCPAMYSTSVHPKAAY